MAIIVARFLPIFRTLVPIAAGLGTMRYSTFLRYNIAGALIWGISIPVLGYYLGTLIPDIDRFLLPILFVVIAISVGSAVREVLKARHEMKGEVL